MKYFMSLLFIIFIVLGIFSVFAQDAPEQKKMDAPQQETEEQRVERMLAQFDNPSAEQGSIVISFTATTNKQQAIRILENFDLTLSETKLCMSIVNAGEEPSRQECSVVDSWDENLKIATADVPAGMDLKILALELYQHDDVEWVEPSYTATLSNEEQNVYNDGQNPSQSLQDALLDELSVFERIWEWFKGLFS